MARGSIRRHERQGSISYEVVVDLGMNPVTGKRRQRSKSFKTKREASVQLNVWQVEIDKGTAVDRSKQTVAEMLHYWLDTHARPSVRAVTLESYERTVEKYLIPSLGRIKIQKLTPDQVQKFYGDMFAAGRGARTVQLCHQRLVQALDQAVELGLVPRNVAKVARPPRVTQHEMSIWTAAQARQFLEAAKHSHLGPIWLLSLATGMRRGELLGLRWQDVNFDANMVSVVQTVGVLHGAPELKPPKSRSSRRTLPVDASVMAALHEHKSKQNEQRLRHGASWQHNDLVFCTRTGTPLNPNNLTRDYDQWVRVAGVPRIRIHDQRHTHVSLALQQGANIKAVSQRVGHANTGITLNLYAHTIPEQHAEVVNKLSSVLFAPVVQNAG